MKMCCVTCMYVCMWVSMYVSICITCAAAYTSVFLAATAPKNRKGWIKVGWVRRIDMETQRDKEEQHTDRQTQTILNEGQIK